MRFFRERSVTRESMKKARADVAAIKLASRALSLSLSPSDVCGCVMCVGYGRIFLFLIALLKYLIF